MAINVNKMMTDEAKTANHYRIRKLLTLEKRQQLLLSNVFGTVPLVELFTIPEPFKGKIEHIVITQ
jgi:hypothetical protein